MSDPVPTYRSCLTCGRLMAVQAESKQVYCSPDCARDNLPCAVCGRFFERGQGVTNAAEQELCSEACAVTETRFDRFFKELP